MRVYDKITEEQSNNLRKGVIEVSGKAMNRTALGIVHAMVLLYPKATFAELKEMLPDSINPSAPRNFKSLFRPHSEVDYGVIQPGSIREECQRQGLDVGGSHFTESDEVLRSSDGIEILVAKSWESKDTLTGEHDLQNLIEHVAQFGVRVVEFDRNVPGEKGGFTLRVIDPKAVEDMTKGTVKQPYPKWILIIILALVLLILLNLYAFLA